MRWNVQSDRGVSRCGTRAASGESGESRSAGIRSRAARVTVSVLALLFELRMNASAALLEIGVPKPPKVVCMDWIQADQPTDSAEDDSSHEHHPMGHPLGMSDFPEQHSPRDTRRNRSEPHRGAGGTPALPARRCPQSAPRRCSFHRTGRIFQRVLAYAKTDHIGGPTALGNRFVLRRCFG